MSMKRLFRVTWKKPTGETASVDIEAESKGQARRIFIQRGGEILQASARPGSQIFPTIPGS